MATTPDETAEAMIEHAVAEPGEFHKDSPDGTIELDGGGWLDVWTAAPSLEGRRTVHLSFHSDDGDSAYRLYADHFSTFDGEDRPGRPGLPSAGTCLCGGAEFMFWEVVGDPHRAVVQHDGAILVARESADGVDETQLDQYLECTACSMQYQLPHHEHAVRVVPELDLGI